MKPREDMFSLCIIRAVAPGSELPVDVNSGASHDPNECVVIRSIRKLVAVDLSEDDLSQLGLKNCMLELESESVEPGAEKMDKVQDTQGIVSATIKVVEEQIRNLDLETEMLSIRKRALRRRLKVLDKLAKSLDVQRQESDAT